MSSINFLRWFLAFSMLVPIACSDSVKRMTRATVVKPELHSENFLMSLLTDATGEQKLLSFSSVKNFYALKDYEPVWTNKNSLTQQGDSLIKIISSAPYFGLVAEDYHMKEINEIIRETQFSENEDRQFSELDVLMTDALIGIGYHIRHGRIHKNSMHRYDNLPETDTALIEILSAAVSENRIVRGLEALEPRNRAYKILKRDLKNKIDSLSLADSVVNTMLEEQVRQLTVNMEQLRWEPTDSSRYILVNIPSFKLGIMEHDSIVFESNVVVGTTDNPTPTLDAVIKSFMLFPPWNVPRKIAARELLPKIKSDSAYLASHSYRVYDAYGKKVHPDSVNWREYGINHFPFQLQQSEGDHNALGVIKFVFHNDYDIYLHDTNAKRFFQKEVRALSHGCIRVERAVEMGRFLLGRDNRHCSERDFNFYLKHNKQRQISVDPIDLKIRYYTCEARSDGSVLFHPDVYGMNSKLVEAMYCRNN